jgi:hypothetical protein
MIVRSNLDRDAHCECLRCDCLPAVWLWVLRDPDDDEVSVYHDPPVARLLRSEDGHP